MILPQNGSNGAWAEQRIALANANNRCIESKLALQRLQKYASILINFIVQAIVVFDVRRCLRVGYNVGAVLQHAYTNAFF